MVKRALPEEEALEAVIYRDARRGLFGAERVDDHGLTRPSQSSPK